MRKNTSGDGSSRRPFALVHIEEQRTRLMEFPSWAYSWSRASARSRTLTSPLADGVRDRPELPQITARMEKCRHAAFGESLSTCRDTLSGCVMDERPCLLHGDVSGGVYCLC